MSTGPERLAIALLHHPVLNKRAEMIGSAVTNLDLHDIARTAKTYGLTNYYVATPYADQHELIGEIVDHWRHGQGATANPSRKEALSLIRTAYGLDEIIADIRRRHGEKPLLVATSASGQKKQVSYKEVRRLLTEDTTPVLLIFGTAHGLAPEVLNKAEASLPPIQGPSTYNHLPVRSAVAIILDRLLGRDYK